MFMRSIAILILTALLLVLPLEPVLAQGLHGNGPYATRNILEAYCANQGGYPQDGKCHFPDGGYCELRSFFNGTCPGPEYYEQLMWMSEAYAFLNGGYSSSYCHIRIRVRTRIHTRIRMAILIGTRRTTLITTSQPMHQDTVHNGPDTIDKIAASGIRFPKSIFWSIREEIEPLKGVMLSRVCFAKLKPGFPV